MEITEGDELSFSFFEYLAAIVGAIAATGGTAALVLKLFGDVISKGLVEKFKSDLQQEVESYKTKLKTSEFVFEKQYEAASEFITMKRGFLPRYRHPGMDWDDAREEMARDLGKIERQLDGYISTNAAILPEETLQSFRAAEGIVAEAKFDWEGGEPSLEALRAVDQMWDTLEKIEHELKDMVLSQSST